jgi:hypothetical protein
MATAILRSVCAPALTLHLEGPLQDLLDHLQEWAHDQSADNVTGLAPILQKWPANAPQAQRAADLKARLTTADRAPATL